MAESQLSIQEQIDQINKELLNLRNSHDGLTYGSGGGNVRTVGVLARNAFRNTESLDRRLDNLEIDLEYLRENLDELVNVEGVDGLEYKNNMLFLTKKGEKILPGVRIVAGSGGPGTGTLPSTMEVTIENLKETLKYLKNKAANKDKKQPILGELWNRVNEKPIDYKGELIDFEIDLSVDNIFIAA